MWVCIYACRYLLLESQSAQTWLPLTCRIEEPAAGSTPELLRFYKQTNGHTWNHDSWRELSEAISIVISKFILKFRPGHCNITSQFLWRCICLFRRSSVIVTLRFGRWDVASRTLASLALELSLHCRLVNICCSIAVIHSSRSYKNNNNLIGNKTAFQ